MDNSRQRFIHASVGASLLTALLSGCAPVQRYRPQPISPAETASSLETRTLEDPGLRLFLERSLGRSIAWPPKVWDLRMLTLAAFYFNPWLESARAQAATAQAGVLTAGMRPNPTLSVTPGIPSPYLMGLELALPVITAGKREYRVEAAKDLSEAARLNLAETAWMVRSGVRAALLDVVIADQREALLHAQAQLQSERYNRLRTELAAGEVAKPAVDAAQTDLLNIRLAERAAEGVGNQARAALAAAIGMPVSGLGNPRFDWPGMGQLPAFNPPSASQIQRDAVLNRLDVQRALVEYKAAQAALQLEIARQHPDYQIGPGYQYEERNNFFAPSFSITLPLFNRNEGPIAEAEARRKQAADHLLATQALIIAESDQALARYRGALAGLNDAQEVRRNLREVRVPTARRQVSAGEAEWLSLNTVLLEESAASLAWLNQLSQAEAALGALEDAIQKPLQPADRAPLILPGAAEGRRTH